MLEKEKYSENLAAVSPYNHIGLNRTLGSDVPLSLSDTNL